MTAVADLPLQLPAQAPPRNERGESYLGVARTVRSWVVTTDHKRIGVLYLFSVLFFLFLGYALHRPRSSARPRETPS
jgi:hypothetical protein